MKDPVNLIIPGISFIDLLFGLIVTVCVLAFVFVLLHQTLFKRFEADTRQSLASKTRKNTQRNTLLGISPEHHKKHKRGGRKRK